MEKINTYAQLIGKKKTLPSKKQSFEKGIKSKTIKKRLLKESQNVFCLPDDDGNDITEDDITNGILRITVNTKLNFPQTKQQIDIEIKDQKFSVNYNPRDNKSGRLSIRKPGMELLRLKKGDKLKFTKVGDIYKIEKKQITKKVNNKFQDQNGRLN